MSLDTACFQQVMAAMFDKEMQLIEVLGETLDGLDVALCLFDNDDKTQYWNRTFLKIFPEHDGHVHVGEAYRENLHRFYATRLSDEEISQIERYIEGGVARHRVQHRPFVFEHHGVRIRVASLPLHQLGRIRIWRADDLSARDDLPKPLILSGSSVGAPPASTELIDRVPDGLMICGEDGSIEWVNNPFVLMYGLHNRNVALGTRFEDIYRMTWERADQAERHRYESGRTILRENLRFSGAPFELPMPGNQYIRVIASAAEDGATFYAHVNITELRRAYEKITAIEVEQSRLQEREGILQDVHDGFGSQISSVRLMVEQGNLTQTQLVDALHECMADLHLVVDTLSHSASGLADAFVDFKFRTERRMSRFPVKLHWEINLEHAPHMSQRNILQVLRIIQEALNNAIKHANAKNIWISADSTNTGMLRMKVHDDGNGLPEVIRSGRGLNNMKGRARNIGATFEIQPHPAGGTQVELLLS